MSCRKSVRHRRKDASDTCCSDGTVDLWLEDDFNAASRMPAGRPYGRRENVAWSGKEAPDAGVAVHTVYIKCVARQAPGLASLHA